MKCSVAHELAFSVPLQIVIRSNSIRVIFSLLLLETVNTLKCVITVRKKCIFGNNLFYTKYILNLSGIAYKIRTIAMFEIVDLQTIFHT
jgi:hypothetical protein